MWRRYQNGRNHQSFQGKYPCDALHREEISRLRRLVGRVVCKRLFLRSRAQGYEDMARRKRRRVILRERPMPALYNAGRKRQCDSRLLLLCRIKIRDKLKGLFPFIDYFSRVFCRIMIYFIYTEIGDDRGWTYALKSIPSVFLKNYLTAALPKSQKLNKFCMQHVLIFRN